MNIFFRTFFITIIVLLIGGCNQQSININEAFQNPPESAKPWVFWYWMHASVSKEGITADLEAMKKVGIGGAYLMPIKGPTEPPLIDPPVEQLSEEWWDMVIHAMNEADRLGLKMGMHASDGFALAGGPWITPEHSMQKVVYAETVVERGRMIHDTLAQPETVEGYYKDIAIFALPVIDGTNISTQTVKPKVTTSLPGVDAQFLTNPDNKQRLRSEKPCWIQYEFDQPFTCRSIVIRTIGNNYHSHRLMIEASEDGENYRSIGRIQPPRHGWQDTDADVTHSIPVATAKYFRFVFDKSGSEPGAEDLDAAKWKPILKIAGIELSAAPKIHQFEGKTGKVWRISPRTNLDQIPDSFFIPLNEVIDLSGKMNQDGCLHWEVPDGQWRILRIGHTSTGHTNYTGGAGKGLECDKFNPEAAKLQFDKWFGEAIRRAGPDLSQNVLKIFHVDSWECGSQNWSLVFRDEFQKRRGYDLYQYLPVMAGYPVENIDISERFLHDIRETITELVVDNFYHTLAELAHQNNCEFSAECIAPTFTSDGMMHYKLVDLPMGEFWLQSPTHDKPNDMLDAISGAHIYGKQIIQAEAFTQLRMAWDEHPAMLKALGDRNFALGVNKLVFHIFAHNPWLDRKPGMTLDGVGLYFQRDQTWWEQSRAWMEYIQRCQALLQFGIPVVDIAVFTSEEVPRRAILPDRLVAILPGIIGKEVLEKEKLRLENKNEPIREMPDGVFHSANMVDPENWLDPLRGYKFDSFNKDALLSLAEVKDGKIIVPGGISYSVLVIPGYRKMSPDSNSMTPEVAAKIMKIVKEGATVILGSHPDYSPSLTEYKESDILIKEFYKKIRNTKSTIINDEIFGDIEILNIGKGRIIKAPLYAGSFNKLGIQRDVIFSNLNGNPVDAIAWTHRKLEDKDIYFISNQIPDQRIINISLRETGRKPEILDAVTGDVFLASEWRIENSRTIIPVRLEPNGSIFIVLQQKTKNKFCSTGKNWTDVQPFQSISGDWTVIFDQSNDFSKDTIIFNDLINWNISSNNSIKYYSGTAIYRTEFELDSIYLLEQKVWIDLGQVANIAEVYLNGNLCGITWTSPYRVNISEEIKRGENILEVKVTNTWANRLIGDHYLPKEEKITWTTAPFRLEGKPLVESGLLGPVNLVIIDEK